MSNGLHQHAKAADILPNPEMACANRSCGTDLRVISVTVMIIRKDQSVCGYPIADIRKLLRAIGWLDVSPKFFEQLLGLSPKQAERLASRLEKGGYICKVGKDGQTLYRTTLDGNRLAGATTRTISRKVAERNLKEFMRRVDAVNSNPDYMYTVTGVMLFGSMLTDRDKVGDIDLALQLQRKPFDDETYTRAAAERVRVAIERGRWFTNIVDRAFWPIIEIKVFLKSKMRGLSVHDLEELQHLPAFDCKVLLGSTNEFAALLPQAKFVP
ncbi:MAG: hypothetical protein ABSB82_00430 [Terriglobia bacterium]